MTKPHNDECRERTRTIIERTLTGKARMNAYRDRIAETERVKERKRARVERGAGNVPMEHWNRDDEQVMVRHADASGGDVRENQHEEDRLRDIHVARGDQRQQMKNNRKLGTVRFEQELLWMEIRQGRHKVGRGPYLSRSQVMLMTTDEFLR